MPKHGPETTVEIRAAVVTLRMFTDKPFTIIGQHLQLNPNTCKSIWQRAKVRNGGTEDIGMFRHLADAPRPGRKLTPPSSVQKVVRKPSRQDMTFELRDGQWVCVSKSGSPLVDTQSPNIPPPPVVVAEEQQQQQQQRPEIGTATPAVETAYSNHTSPRQPADTWHHSTSASPAAADTPRSNHVAPVENVPRSRTGTPAADTHRSGSIAPVAGVPPEETTRSSEKSPAPTNPEVAVSGASEST